MILENRRERFILTPGRTHNRIRSPRLAASSRWNNVSKGSRQVRSVTSGKGLALRVEWLEPEFRSDCLGGDYLGLALGLDRGGPCSDGRGRSPVVDRRQRHPSSTKNN